MNPFRYAKNFFSDDFLPQQVILATAILLLAIVLVMAGLVLIRRAFGLPRHSSSGAPPPPGLASFERYEIGARLWHIGLVGILGALVISGAAFFAPGIIPGPVPVLGLSWLFVHLAFAVMLMGGTVVHIIKVLRLDPGQMWFDRRDWPQLMAGVRYYVGRPHELPKLGKYSVWSKVFHVLLVLLTLVMVVSGISLTLDTLGWAQIDQNWQRKQRLLHDLGTYGFVALIVGHVFWQLLKSRAQLMAMITGKVAVDTFTAHHDWDRWKPDALGPDGRKVGDGR
jgi:cytochrome b subunit of formate dehydrogenase